MIFVLIKSPNNVFSVQVEENDTILTLRKKVAERTENLYQLFQFELNFNGKTLSDSSTVSAEGILMETLVDMVVIRELKYTVEYKSASHEITIANNQGLKVAHLINHIKEVLKLSNDLGLTLNKKRTEHYVLANHDVLELNEVTTPTVAGAAAMTDGERDLLSNFVDTAVSSDVEIVFVFDTTGSMSSIIANVKSQVEATITRLTKDIPNIKIGIMGLGDFCDGQNVLKTLDLTDDKTKLINFIKKVPMTGGGDAPEAYEFALYMANSLSWSAHTSKALVMIGDEGPHPPSTTDLKINWIQQADDLAAKGVKIYGIRAKCSQPAFYNEIAERTGGIAIDFDRFNLITEMFMAICYRETSARKFQAFQNEVFSNTNGIPVEMTRIFDDLNKENFAREDSHEIPAAATTTTTTTTTADATTPAASDASPKKVYGQPLTPLKSTASWFNISADNGLPSYYFNSTTGYFTTYKSGTTGVPTPISAAPKTITPLAVTFAKPAAPAPKKAAAKPAPKKENKKKLEKVKVQMETRLRKKARESLDFIAGSKQRQESLFNLLGKDYTGPTEQELEMIFRVFDTNNDGRITAAELGAVLQSMGKRAVTKRIDKILSEIDENHTGYVEMEDFVTYMQAKAYKKATQMGLIEEESDEDEEEEEEEEEGGDTDEEMDEKPVRKAKSTTAKRKRTTTTTTPKKKTTAEKKSPASKEKKAPAATTTATPAAPTAPAALKKQPSYFGALKRGASLCHYYTDNAGKHNALLVSNPVGPQFDLGLDDAFLDFNVLVQLPAGDTKLESVLNQFVKTKGFNMTYVHDDESVVKQLTGTTGKDIDILVVISSDNASTTAAPSAAYNKAVVDFNHSGKGLFILSDKSAFAQANSIVTTLYGEGFQVRDIATAESAPATESEKVVLEYSDGKNTVAKQFKGHLITTGLVKLDQGESPSQLSGCPTQLDPLAISSQNTATILHSNDTNPDNYGRVVVDTSYKKIDANNTVGHDDIERYLCNVLVWLLGIDHRFRHNLPVKGGLRMREVVTWQYLHGSWLNYDQEASSICEEAYQDWKKNPGVDVRSVKSGLWSYQVNFKDLLQTNVLHSAHTQRPVRRFVQQIVNNN
ncbi:hypothetical protein PPL_03939 [Heterostelium album PN500]|uniref:Calmodulin n=1 Tax=Heterostelium pallidum (strain ATCC 26659 / Pp 5 / PN500) TaxID=670386 RepID=D3B5K1_HETP5|nr:hypothetical protein PPL_03939 [Heterostelium album PN500]EFA83149.1 hypothetical protein PPL_03939 [Heterostelium album PN500]|eukprot:XP_020435266.1 hypothetical protein PPL_03939 [Heterostelium album PN500]